MVNEKKIHQLAKTVLETEAEAILGLRDRLDKNFTKACKLLLDCQGRIIVIGIGKSGHIANKVAATLTSTGSPAFFIHPSEASHGDIGIITKKDVVLIISYSGNTEEIISILPVIKLLEVPLISITGNPNSTLAKMASVNLNINIKKEACPLGLAPTASTTATLAMGDALAISLLETRGFTAKDFAKSHPGGTLGKRLLLRVKNIMRVGNAMPKVEKNTMLARALIEITNKHMGMTMVIDDDNTLAGIFTDGDLRRVIDKNLDIHNTKILEVMTTKCKTITSEMLAAEAIQIMEQHQITSLVVVDENRIPIGVIHMHDLLKSGLM